MNEESRKKRIIDTLSSCANFGDSINFYNELIQLKGEFYQDEEKSTLFNYLEAFGNKERFLILDMLKEKDRCVCELEAILQKTQPAVSHHLRILEKNNLIQATKVGKFSHYSLVRSEFEKDRCVCELEAILQKTQPAVSHHLRILEKNNLIQATKVGKFSHYALVRSEFEKFQTMWKKWADGITNWFGN